MIGRPAAPIALVALGVATLLACAGCGGARRDAPPGACHYQARYLGGQGATGMLETFFAITSTDGRCALRGVPTLRLIGPHGRQLPTQQATELRDTQAASTVTVDPTHPAVFAVAYFFNTPGGRRACRRPAAVEIRLPHVARAIRSRVPGGDGATRRFTSCGGRIWVGPLRDA